MGHKPGRAGYRHWTEDMPGTSIGRDCSDYSASTRRAAKVLLILLGIVLVSIGVWLGGGLP